LLFGFGGSFVGVFPGLSRGFGFRRGFGRRLFNLVLAGGFLSGFRLGFGLLVGLVGGLEILRRFPGFCLGAFERLFGSRSRFRGLHQFLLFLRESFFSCFTGFGGFFRPFDLRRLIGLR